MSTQIEDSLLNILFTCENKQAFIFDKMKKEFFTSTNASKVFECAKEMYLNNGDLDVTLLCEQTKLSEYIGKIFLLDELSFRAEKYCNVIFENFIARFIKSAKTIEHLNEIENYKQEFELKTSKIKPISTKADEFLTNYEKRIQSNLSTYYRELDEYVGSFMGGDYIAFGGGAGMGKTLFALNLAQRACLQGKKVLYVSLEMSLEQLQNRFICMTEGIDARKYRSCTLDLTDIQKYKNGLDGLKEWNLHILDDYNLTIEKLRIYLKNNSFDFIVIDYLGLIKGFNNKGSYERTTAISRELKLLALDLNVPIMVLVQLNRNFSDRSDKRPVLSDIRDSGAIEQDADFVLFGYRELDLPSIYEVIIAKNRHGVNNKIIKLKADLKTQVIYE